MNSLLSNAKRNMLRVIRLDLQFKITNYYKKRTNHKLLTNVQHLLFIPVTTGSFSVDNTLTVKLSIFNAAFIDDDFLNTI